MRRKLLLLAAVVAASTTVEATDRPTLHMGAISAEVPATMRQRIEPLAKYLTSRTGITVIPRPGPNHNAVVNDLAKNITQIAYLTPVAYITAREQRGLRTIAIPLVDGKPVSHSVVVVRRDSPIQMLQELRGKKFALGDPRALLQPATLYLAGMTLDGFGHIAYLRHNDNVAKAVLHKDFDGGIMPQPHAVLYTDLRVIHVSPPIPTNPIVARDDVPEEQIDALREALLSLNPNVAQDRAILQSLDPSCTGFSAVQDRDFDGVRKMMEPLLLKPKVGTPG
jgi:phosphonate transport system substrate-binding protein